MSDTDEHASTPDVGAYCRAIETHLCVRNGGHRIRLVGPAFDVARAWHRAGIPLKVVERAIDRRVERAEQRGVRRPLRLEYCDDDVQQVFAEWRRAVGPAVSHLDSTTGDVGTPGEDAPATRSLPRHLDRIATRLSSAVVQWPDGALRDLGTTTLAEIATLRAAAPKARGDAREAVFARLSALDDTWNAAVIAHAGGDDAARARAEAERDLAQYRERMPRAEFARATEGLAARVLREAMGVPRFSP